MGSYLPECLSRSIEIHRCGALQFDGKSDGKRVALSARQRFTVRSISMLTVNSRRKVQHPCGFPGDRRAELADGKSRAPGREGTPMRRAAWLRDEHGTGVAGEGTTCLLLIFGTTSSTAALSNVDPAVATVGNSRPGRPLIVTPFVVHGCGHRTSNARNAVRQRSHRRAQGPARPGHLRSMNVGIVTDRKGAEAAHPDTKQAGCPLTRNERQPSHA